MDRLDGFWAVAVLPGSSYCSSIPSRPVQRHAPVLGRTHDPFPHDPRGDGLHRPLDGGRRAGPPDEFRVEAVVGGRTPRPWPPWPAASAPASRPSPIRTGGRRAQGRRWPGGIAAGPGRGRPGGGRPGRRCGAGRHQRDRGPAPHLCGPEAGAADRARQQGEPRLRRAGLHGRCAPDRRRVHAGGFRAQRARSGPGGRARTGRALRHHHGLGRAVPDLERERIAACTPAEAAAHPVWSMGSKINIDSATLMNKGLELIEAHHLFGLEPSVSTWWSTRSPSCTASSSGATAP
jgi:hypothetical protein